MSSDFTSLYKNVKGRPFTLPRASLHFSSLSPAFSGRAFGEIWRLVIRRQDLLAENYVRDLLCGVVSFGIGYFVLVNNQGDRVN